MRQEGQFCQFVGEIPLLIGFSYFRKKNHLTFAITIIVVKLNDKNYGNHLLRT